ncbi:hypothetical protein [uncultured Cellulomonas sp.]|uniref:hypothetical protein n=1 Tax=uncultured Cellulomonas sp. TaxID=189682 RepID=UPI0028E2F1DF|nr:hypothetical protein [uncultured Cellulomonas sp.]
MPLEQQQRRVVLDALAACACSTRPAPRRRALRSAFTVSVATMAAPRSCPVASVSEAVSRWAEAT